MYRLFEKFRRREVRSPMALKKFLQLTIQMQAHEARTTHYYEKGGTAVYQPAIDVISVLLRWDWQQLEVATCLMLVIICISPR